MTSVETASSNGYTTIFAKHVASVLDIPEKMFKLGYMNFLPGMMVQYITTESHKEILMQRKVSK